MPEALAFNLNFVHPLLMWSLLAASAYALFLGIKAKKTRTGTPEQRKELIKGKFAQRHYFMGSLVLAVMADFLPSGVGNALGANAGGNSLDNTIRYMNFVPTEWVLADIRIHAVHAGFAHGRVHLFAQDGTLLATASQSLIVRIHS